MRCAEHLTAQSALPLWYNYAGTISRGSQKAMCSRPSVLAAQRHTHPTLCEHVWPTIHDKASLGGTTNPRVMTASNIDLPTSSQPHQFHHFTSLTRSSCLLEITWRASIFVSGSRYAAIASALNSRLNLPPGASSFTAATSVVRVVAAVRGAAADVES